MLYVDQDMEQLRIRSTSITAVKDGHVGHLIIVFNMTTFHCRDLGWSFSKTASRFDLRIARILYFSMRHPVYRCVHAPFCGRLCWYRDVEMCRRRRLTRDKNSSRRTSLAAPTSFYPAISPALCCSSQASDFCVDFTHQTSKLNFT